VAFDTLVVLLSILAGLFAPSFKRMDCNQQIASKRVVACHDIVLFRTGFLDLLFFHPKHLLLMPPLRILTYHSLSGALSS